MNWGLAGLVYLVAVPTIMYLASKVDNKTIYKLMLIVLVILSFIPISLGVMLLNITFQNNEWDLWSYITFSAGIFCVLFGIGVVSPVYWMYEQK